MLKKTFFVLLSVFIIVGYAIAADWVQIDEKMYMDASSLNKYDYKFNHNKDDLYSIWVKSLNSGTQPWIDIEKITGEKIWYTKDLIIFNCTRREIAFKSSVYYNLKNNVVKSYDESYLNWLSVVPETVGELQYIAVCSAVSDMQETNSVKIKYQKKWTPIRTVSPSN